MSDSHFDAGPGAPGRRYVALLFADLSHSTELAGAMEAEDYAALLSALRHVYQEAIPKHGGVVVRVQGDGLLAMFGYPQTREDDGRRAVDAALELHRSVRGLRVALPAGRTLSLHSGIHSGLVLIGAGDIERGRFELLGAVPHIAARLSDAAQPHEILVSEEALGPARRYFRTAAPRRLQVKGRDTPVLAHPVDARADDALGAEAHAGRGMSPFIGRAAEIELLEQRLAEAMGGKPRSVAIAAAPGMGKTRLIEHFLRRAMARGCQVLRGYCESDLGAVPLQPFRQMLSSEAGVDGRPEAAEDFVRLLARRAESQPTVVFVDDWHWADDASKQVLAALRRLTDRRLLLLLSTRPAEHGEVIAVAAQTIVLAPLSEAEAAQAIATRLPGADPFVAAEIARHAGGNPLFIEELCHSAALGGSGLRPDRLRRDAGWLDQLVESRVQRLPAAQIELVRVAAVIGNVLPIWLLSSITGHGVDSPAVRGLAAQDFVFPGEHPGTLRFKHGLTRDIIYESVGLHARQRLHRRIAEAIRQRSAAEAQEEALEALAYHFDAGGDAEQAAHYAELAGDKALAASALDRARAQYRAALAALDRLPPSAEGARRWVAIVQRLGLVCVYDPLRSELALSRRALHLAEQFGDPATVARARYWLAYISYSLGEARAAIAHGERALAEAEAAGEQRLATQIVATLGESHATAANYGPALELLGRAIDVKRRHRSGRNTNVGLAFSLVCRAYVLGDRGEFALAYECFDEALACIGDVTHEIAATTHGWRSAVLLWQGRWAEASEAARESGRIAEATRSLSQLSIARAIGAHAAWMLERDPRAVQAIVEATDWLAPRESGLFRSLNHGWLAEGLIAVGRRKEGRHHAALALRRARERDLLGVGMTYRALARDAAATRPDAARRYIERAYATADARDSAHERAVTQLCEAEMALHHGHARQALALLDQAAAAFDAMFMAWHLGEAVRLREQASRRAG
ncbi:hypothetical protein GCM10023165_51940 [Variovorax defluvii]|uniref:Guanylate cyclase domain-containing protein n=1 Tax=Variovorax defluvii TaxID=913761 RepID=A0ABP8IFL5_9BURK